MGLQQANTPCLSLGKISAICSNMWFGNTYLRRIFQDLFHYHFALHCLISIHMIILQKISVYIRIRTKFDLFLTETLIYVKVIRQNKNHVKVTLARQDHHSASQSWSSIHALLMSPQPDLYQDHQVCSISRSPQLDKCQGHLCLTNVKVTYV